MGVNVEEDAVTAFRGVLDRRVAESTLEEDGAEGFDGL